MERLLASKRESSPYGAVHSLIRRLSFMARKSTLKNPTRVKMILQFFGVMGGQLFTAEQLAEFLVPILHPIYRLTQLEAGYLQDDVKKNSEFANEVLQSPSSALLPS